MRDSLIKLMPWMGGKGQLMWAIQMLLPIHYKTLVDVFGGSGIITLNTAVPKGCLQIYNDLNHDLYNLLFCVKHRPTPTKNAGVDGGLRNVQLLSDLPRTAFFYKSHF